MPWTPDNPPPPIQAYIRAAGRSKKQSLQLASPLGPGLSEQIAPLPFTQAIEFARSREIVLPAVYYGELVGIARAQSFSIAGVASIDQLQGVLDSLSRSMAGGESFREWKQRVRSREIGLALPDHRLDNIFRTNLQTHYSRGRAENHRRNRDKRPYFVWDAVDDSRTRPTHAAMDGHTAPQTDDIWRRWSPPAGYRCRCRRLAVSEKQAERFRRADERRLVSDSERANARRKALIDGPDEGFDYDMLEDFGLGVARTIEQRKNTLNASLSRALTQKLESKPQRLPFDDIVSRGQGLTNEIKNEISGNEVFGVAFRRQLRKRLESEGRTLSKPAKLASRGRGADLVKSASMEYPDSWTTKADDFGELRVRFSNSRAFQISLMKDKGRVKTPSFGVVDGKRGLGLLVVNDKRSAVHEYAHRLQHAMPELDDYFQELHQRRTQKDKLKRLSTFGRIYRANEVTRDDDYIHPYFGKEYEKAEYRGRAGALEVMAMTFETIFSKFASKDFDDLIEQDPELFNLAIGLLFNYDP